MERSRRPDPTSLAGGSGRAAEMAGKGLRSAFLRDLQRDNRLIRDPVDVFNERCFIGFESDETLVYRLWDVFQDVGIWSSDYPHHDAEDAWEALELMAKHNVPEATQRRLLGDNARRLYGIDPVLVVTERVKEHRPAILPW